MVTWTNVFLSVMLGISLYTNFDLLNKYEQCSIVDYMQGPVQDLTPKTMLRVQFLADAYGSMSRTEYFESVAETVEDIHGLPKGLLQSILWTESRYDPNARGAAGEIGIAQIKPTTLMKFCPQCVNTGNLFIGRGSKGDLVKKIQVAMSLNNRLAIKDITTVYDAITETAVLQFQKDHKLRADGIVGPDTWKAITGLDMPVGESIEKKLLDPVKSINYAGLYLVWLRNKLGTNDADILAASYNGGPANMTVNYMLKIRTAREGRYVN